MASHRLGSDAHAALAMLFDDPAVVETGLQRMPLLKEERAHARRAHL